MSSPVSQPTPNLDEQRHQTWTSFPLQISLIGGESDVLWSLFEFLQGTKRRRLYGVHFHKNTSPTEFCTSTETSIPWLASEWGLETDAKYREGRRTHL